MAVARIDRALATRRTPDTLHRSGLAHLLLGNVDLAMSLLRDAVDSRPTDADAWSDLAAAHLVAATSHPENRGEQLVRALNATTRATVLAPEESEPWFNLALTQERIGMVGAARRSWMQFLQRERAPQWRHEGDERLATLSHADATERWKQAREELQRLDVGISGERVAALVRQDRQSVREWLGDDLLGQWGAAVLAGDEDGAELALRRSEDIAAALAASADDALELDTADAVRRSAQLPDQRRALALGHDAYAKGRALYDQDRRRDAEALFTRSASLLRDGASPFWAWARLQQGLTAYHRRSYEESTAALQEVVLFAEPHRYRTLWARARWLQGLVRLQTDSPAPALAAYREALVEFQRLDEIENTVGASGSSADALRILGNAEGGWNAIVDALERLPEVRRPIRRYNILLNASLFALREELLDASLQFQDAAVEEALRRGGPAAPLEALMRRAVVHHHRGEDVEATSDLNRAEHLLPDVADPAQAQYFAGWLDAVGGELLGDRDPQTAAMRLQRALPNFERSEPAEVPRLYLLLGRSALADRRPADAAQLFERGIDIFETRRRLLPQDDLRVSYFDEAWQLFAELMDLHDRAGQAALVFRDAERARARSLRDAMVTSSEITQAADLQPRLHQDEAMLHYTFVSDRLVTWIVTREVTKPIERPVSQHDLERDIARYLDALSKTDVRDGRSAEAQSRERGEALFDLLVRPVLPAIPRDATLIVVADGPLHLLPFGTLWDASRRRYLIEDHAVIVAPSATLWRPRGLTADVERRAAAARTRDVLVIGNPTLGASGHDRLPPLPYAEAEAREIAKLYDRSTVLIGREATRSRVLGALASHAVVHLASHAVADGDFPSYSRLLLAPDARGDGSVFAYELARQTLTRTQLVVLSACRTGRGPIRRGEGVLSLARPFLLAGVPTVIASAWDVDDRATSELFRRFHAALRDGTPATAALRGAQLSLLASADESLRAPSAWGGFFSITTGVTKLTAPMAQTASIDGR